MADQRTPFSLTLPWGMTVYVEYVDNQPHLGVRDDDDDYVQTALTPEAMRIIAAELTRMAEADGPPPVVRSARIERAAEVLHDSATWSGRWALCNESHREKYRTQARALAEAGLLVDTAHQATVDYNALREQAAQAAMTEWQKHAVLCEHGQVVPVGNLVDAVLAVVRPVLAAKAAEIEWLRDKLTDAVDAITAEGWERVAADFEAEAERSHADESGGGEHHA